MVCRIYSWSPYTPDPNNKYPNMKFMAQLWGSDQISDFESVVKAGYADFILGFNEYVCQKPCYITTY